MVAADLYGDAIPVEEFGFRVARNVFPDGGPTLHGKTGTEMSRILNPDEPSKWRDADYSVHVDLRGPRGSLSGYVEAGMFAAICAALGVQS